MKNKANTTDITNTPNATADKLVSTEWELHKKLSIIQQEIEAPKDKHNSFGGYSYRSCEGILRAAKPLLKKYNVHLHITDYIEHIGGRWYIVATAILSDYDKVENEKIATSGWAREDENIKGMHASQITGSTSSYARKYALQALFLLDDGADSDATNKHEEGTSKYTDNPKDAEKNILNVRAILKEVKPTKSPHFKIVSFDNGTRASINTNHEAWEKVKKLEGKKVVAKLEKNGKWNTLLEIDEDTKIVIPAAFTEKSLEEMIGGEEKTDDEVPF